MNQFAKAIGAFFTTTAGVATTVLADGKVTPLEAVVGVCTIGAATAAVYALKNTPAPKPATSTRKKGG